MLMFTYLYKNMYYYDRVCLYQLEAKSTNKRKKANRSFWAIKMNKKPVLILLAGGTCSGKSSIASKLQEHFQKIYNKDTIVLSTDSYYHDFSLTLEQKEDIKKNGYQSKHFVNWDDPKNLNLEVLLNDLKNLLENSPIYLPKYNFSEHSLERSKELVKAPIIILEGIFSFYDKDIRELADLKIYVDADDDLRIIRRLKRKFVDFPHIYNKRGKPITYEMGWYRELVKPCHEKYVKPTKTHADLILVNNEENSLGNKAQKIASLINLYFQNEEDFKTQLAQEKTKQNNSRETRETRQQERENVWKQPTLYWGLMIGIGISCLGLGIYWLVRKGRKSTMNK